MKQIADCTVLAAHAEVMAWMPAPARTNVPSPLNPLDVPDNATVKKAARQQIKPFFLHHNGFLPH